MLEVDMYTARKAAQMAAFFTQKQGGSINVLKLTKLLYLADRESIAQYGLPISFDHPVSMPMGPVLTRIRDLTEGGCARSDQAQWDEWISDKSQHLVSLTRTFDLGDLDELSEADIDVLETVWRNFGHMDRYTLRTYTHEHLPEWEDPKGSMIPMSEERRLTAILGDPEEAAVLAEEIEAMRQLGRCAAG